MIQCVGYRRIVNTSGGHVAADWSSVGEAIVARRRELGMTQADVCRAAALSDLTLRRLECGVSLKYRSSTLARVETALHWEPGSVSGLLAGQEPVPIAPPPYEVLVEIMGRLAALERRVDELVSASRSTSPRR